MDDIHFALRSANSMCVRNSSRGVGYLNILSTLKFEQQTRNITVRIDIACMGVIFTRRQTRLLTVIGRKGVACSNYRYIDLPTCIYSEDDEHITRIYMQ